MIREELFIKAANALPQFCLTRSIILISQNRMPLIELWQVLATCLRCLSNTESSFFMDNYEQIVGQAKLGSIEQQTRLADFLKGIQEVMNNIQEAIRLEPKQVLVCDKHYCAKSMTDSSPSAQKVDSPQPTPAQKRDTNSPPPPPPPKKSITAFKRISGSRYRNCPRMPKFHCEG